MSDFAYLNSDVRLVPDGTKPILFHASQYDEGRVFNLHVIDDGEDWVIPDGASATLNALKPDGNVYTAAAGVTSSYAQIVTDSQLTAAAGSVLCEMRFALEGGEDIGTANFVIMVEASPLEGGEVSDSTFGAVQTAIAELQTELDAIEAVLQSYVSSASGSAEEAAESAESAATSAEEAAESAAALSETVVSFNGRTGEVVPESGDYSAEMVTYDNTESGLTSTDAQAAIDELAATASTNADSIAALETVTDSLDSSATYTHGISGGIPYILISGGSESDKVYLITQAMKEGTYDGRNLAEVFDSEIAQYSDAWEWIKDRIDSGYLGDLFTCDYIPIETTDGYSFDMQIMGINTYTGYGSTEIGNMIDFCSRTVHPTSTYFNSSNNNNGSSDNANPFVASYLKTTFLDTVVYLTLPSSVTAQISAKHQYIESRYSSSATLTDSTTQTWQEIDGLWVPSEMEVTGHFGWGTQGYSHEGHIQYPYFVHMHNRVKRNPSGTRCYWWLATPRSGYSTYVCYVSASGNAGNNSASSSYYAPLCFRIAE